MTEQADRASMPWVLDQIKIQLRTVDHLAATLENGEQPDVAGAHRRLREEVERLEVLTESLFAKTCASAGLSVQSQRGNGLTADYPH